MKTLEELLEEAARLPLPPDDPLYTEFVKRYPLTADAGTRMKPKVLREYQEMKVWGVLERHLSPEVLARIRGGAPKLGSR